jgi:CelD/BcsL family acetyltransferase involved in cellulose biosynthesis
MAAINCETRQELDPVLNACSEEAKAVQTSKGSNETWTRRTPLSGTPRRVYRVSPIKDRRWEEFLTRNPGASLFHSSAWLEALQRTYGYEPVVYTTSPPSQRLENGLAFCRVESRLTGCRLVSLPFSDYCQPLAEKATDLIALRTAIEDEVRTRGWRYFEVRPLVPIAMTSPNWHTAAIYFHHQIDLQPEIATLLSNLHKNSIQRKIRRAEREGLTYVSGTTESSLDSFYRLMVQTRRRHGVPPQPKKWFEALVDCFGPALEIRMALKDAKPIAAMLTIRHKDTLVYKYGGSDLQYKKLGGMHLLYWNSIQDAKRSGLRSFDLGRTDIDQSGLSTFKKRWGAHESRISYSRYTYLGDWAHSFESAGPSWKTQTAKFILSHTPNRLLEVLGNRVYRHFG